jgi:hypothetical protein
MKTPGSTVARLEPSLANSSATSFHLWRTWWYSSPSMLLLKICHHLLVEARSFLLSLDDYQQQASQDLQLSDAKYCSNTETMK